MTHFDKAWYQSKNDSNRIYGNDKDSLNFRNVIWNGSLHINVIFKYFDLFQDRREDITDYQRSGCQTTARNGPYVAGVNLNGA